MGRGVEKNSLSTYGAASDQSKSAYNAMNPVYTQMATNPMGYTPQEKADMLTAGEQSVGGSTAGAVGQGDLDAARTGNAGGADMAIDDSARQGMVQNSVDALGVNQADAALKRAQQQEGLNGLSDEYKDANGTAINALGQATNASNNTNSVVQGYIGDYLQMQKNALAAAGGGA